MELFDCYCGIGPWHTRDRLLPYEPAEILRLMDHFGVRRALVHSNFTAGNGAPNRGNQLLREACAGEPRFVPAFSFPVFPYEDSPTVEATLAEMRAGGGRAVWHVGRAGIGFERWLWGDMLDACMAHRLPLLVHRDHVAPDSLARLLADFPALTVVLMGASYAEDWWLYPLMRRSPSLHLALGHFYIIAGGPARFARHLPVERLLFGSGLPFFSPGGMITHVTYSGLPESDQQKILAGNLERLISEVRL